MIIKILNEINNINDRIIKIVNIGFCISLIIGIIGIYLILIYNTYSVTYDFYRGGFILIKTAFTFSAQFIACGFAFDRIINEK